jgi:FkbM family methyltransferase
MVMQVPYARRREAIHRCMKQWLKALLAKLGYQAYGIRYCPRQLLEPDCLRVIGLDDVICRRMFEFGQEFSFIQIGAFDGITKDPLYKYIKRYGWRGVLLEPQPRPVGQLRELYRGNSRIVIVEAALDCRSGTRTLFTVESPNVPVWARGMASFQLQNITKNSYLIPGLEANIKEILVPCIPFEDVLQQVPPGCLDLLQVDAEGADGYILSLFPYGRIKPAIIHWESKNLTKSQQEETLDMLYRYGYRFARSGEEDMLAVLD